MTSPVQEIKDRLDIVEFIRSYLPLQPAGKNFKAPCPFHKERTPSFIVSPERQTWHCFGACSEGGDIFKFLMKHDNLEFYEALKVLAEKAGVELKRISPADQKQFGVLYDINNSAKDFFISQLAEKAGEEALRYLTDRGLKRETIAEFELGFAPNNPDVLSRNLINLGYDIKDIERAGLIFKTERGSYIDRFRGRIMFPIHNHFGKVVGFSGRILPRFDTGETGKYVNSPETPIFSKSRILYGFHKTKKEILAQKSAVLVEGQMDFLMAWQDGVKNAAATSGTALTIEHLKTLRRLADSLVFCFDNDEAGLKAAERSIDSANALDFNVNLLILKDYKDPAEAVQKSPGTLVELIKKAKSAMEFYFDRHLQTVESRENIGDFKKGIRIVLAKIKNLASAVERAHWLKELSIKTGVKEEALAEEMEQLKSANWSNSESVNLKTSKLINQSTNQLISRRELIAQRLLSLILVKENLSSLLKDYIEYLPENYKIIYDVLIQKKETGDGGSDELMNLISLRATFETQGADEEKLNKEFHELLKHLKLEYCNERKRVLSKIIKEAEKNGDEKRLAEVLKEFDQISKSADN